MAAMLGGLSFFSWRDCALALLAVPVLVLALWPFRHVRSDIPTRRMIALVLILSALPLAYLLPLPLELAAHLPGRAVRLQAAIGELGPGQWTAVSLAADDTWQAWLKFIPGLALFLAVLRLTTPQQKRLLSLILGIVLLQSLWGLAQLSSGLDSWLVFYGADGQNRASGGFANRNHFASLLILGLPLLAVLACSGNWGWQRPAHVGWRTLGVLGFLLVTVALVASRSRAAAGLLIIEGCLFSAWLLRHRRVSPGLLIGGSAAALALTVMLLFAPTQLFSGLELGNADGRLGILQRSLAAALDFFPIGAGPGTFGSLFPGFDTRDTLDKVYVNHAHNDALELLFELGAAGIAVYLAVVAAISLGFWRHAVRRGGDAVQWACALGLFALLVHGWVDYPVRVPLVAMVALTFLGVMLGPASPPRARRAGTHESSTVRPAQPSHPSSRASRTVT
ncbi:O-antigen ligase [Tahibacter aquaticus]|uniref:O-antigen ligase n=1 Tax=Tahibacter aquaticus TaxID=520092 RepID=A0A4R6YMU0_9GAMM|nr:O-antigen ligase family protein [Tahibacter aquaticus]TDR38600.1 O-antigen ligase [Tahibacter aquaticus]